MPPKKAAKPNGFIIFAQELKSLHGRKYGSLKDACDGAAPLWANMSKDQRKRYDDRARQMKGQNNPNRYTSEGLVVEDLLREDQEKKQAEEKSRQDIRNIITLAHKKDALDTEVFFVIHCNIFCYHTNVDRYWPAEISVLPFTLKDGVKPENIFHYIINPGELPIGYKFEAKQLSDATHLLSVPVDDDHSTMEEIYFSLKAFLEKKKPAGTKNMPILYADKKHLKMIQRILDCWSEDYDERSIQFKVYNLQVMFYFLRNTVAGDQVWSSITFSDRELEKDVYAYVPEIACSFHSSSAKPLHCSKSIVLRYAFVICDNCCADLNIEYIEGQHVPINSCIPDSASSSVSGWSSRSSRSGRSSRRGFHEDSETESSTNWETESISSISSGSTLVSDLVDLDEQFPSLGKPRSLSQTSSFSNSTPLNSSSVRSYAGATGKSTLPHAFEKSLADMSLSSKPSLPGVGRGFRKAADSNSDVSSGGATSPRVFDGTDGDFPPIRSGRGRAADLKRLGRPGMENNK